MTQKPITAIVTRPPLTRGSVLYAVNRPIGHLTIAMAYSRVLAGQRAKRRPPTKQGRKQMALNLEATNALR